MLSGVCEPSSSTPAALVLLAASESALAFAGFLRPLSRGVSPKDEQMDDRSLDSLSVGTGPAARAIAVRWRDGAHPGLLWLGGLKSDMKGTKAEALARWAGENGRAAVRFDYSGHGESAGNFTEGTIGRWREESLAVFEAFCRGPTVVIG